QAGRRTARDQDYPQDIGCPRMESARNCAGVEHQLRRLVVQTQAGRYSAKEALDYGANSFRARIYTQRSTEQQQRTAAGYRRVALVRFSPGGVGEIGCES